MHIETSLGDVVDRVTILMLKIANISDQQKQDHARHERDVLESAWARAGHPPMHELTSWARLCEVNAALWDVEDHLRELERDRAFEEAFVEAARSVYRLNDERAALKRAINAELGSAIVEVKSYADYDRAEPEPEPEPEPESESQLMNVPTDSLVRRIAATLVAWGARRAWGMPGGDSLPLVDALAEVGIEQILVRDEASAGFAADATAQLEGGVGVCYATLGPGLTNLVSGVAGCLLDRAPVVAVTAAFKPERIGSYTHMMLDQRGIMAPVGKHVVTVHPANAPAELHRALTIATAPRPGPVWLEVPSSAATAASDPEIPVRGPAPAAARSPITPEIAERLAAWERPLILAGFSARYADLAGLARALGAPVLTTYKAKGGIPESDAWSAGAVGLSPVADAVHRELVDAADGLLLLGWDPAELRDHWLPGWSERPEVVVVDTHRPTDIPTRIDGLVVGDIAHWVVEACQSSTASTWRPDAVRAHRERWLHVFEEDSFGPATAVRSVQAAAHPDTVVSLDVGAHRITAAHVWACERPDTLLQSNGFSSMGYGVPAALAAAAAGHRALAIVGDMGFQMTLGELGIVRDQGWDLVVVVFADRSLSLIELKQERRGAPPRMLHFTNPAFGTIARAFGGDGRVVRDRVSLEAAVREAQAAGGLWVIGAEIDPAPYRRQM